MTENKLENEVGKKAANSDHISADSGRIMVTNKCKAPIGVSISKWSGSGSGSKYTIMEDKSESWGRSDSRGFLMRVERDAGAETYYVVSGETITVHAETITSKYPKPVPCK